jgi:hypothetical protein
VSLCWPDASASSDQECGFQTSLCRGSRSGRWVCPSSCTQRNSWRGLTSGLKWEREKNYTRKLPCGTGTQVKPSSADLTSRDSGVRLGRGSFARVDKGNPREGWERGATKKLTAACLPGCTHARARAQTHMSHARLDTCVGHVSASEKRGLH